MKVERLIVGDLQTNCYILTNKDNQALIIDPGDEFDTVLSFCKKYTIVGILVTHHHLDHVGALSELEDYYHLKHNSFHEKEFSYEVLSFPGHTEDSVVYYFPNEKKMFVGDFLFYHSFGRTDLGGNNKQMKESLLKIKEYDEDLVLYPGHGEVTTLKEEKKFFSFYLQMLS